MTAVSPFPRRALLRAGVAGIAATTLVSCTSEPSAPDKPDPLAALAASARADAASAKAIADALPDLAGPAGEVATARGEHAKALQREVDRERPPASKSPAPKNAPTPPPDSASARTMLTEALTAAEKQAGDLVPTVPRYRAGLVGSVAAGCASLREVLA